MFGLATDLTFVLLVEKSKDLMLFQQNYQRPVERKDVSIRAASEGGLLVKPPNLRSIPESDDKNRHLTTDLEIQFPKEEDRYKIPANCVLLVDYILSVTQPRWQGRTGTG